MKAFKFLSFISAMLLLAACGENDTFRILGNVDGLGTQNLRIIYYTDQAVKMATTTAIDGKFNFEGRAAQPVIVEVYTNNTRVPVGRLVIKNGETVNAEWSTSSPTVIKLSGDKTSEKYASFVTDHKEILDPWDTEAVNRAVEEYVASNPKEFLSTVLMLTCYDATDNEAHADSLLSSIDLKARPSSLVEGYTAMLEHSREAVSSAPVMPMSLYCSRDSMTTVNPRRARATLLCFSEAGEGRHDSIVPFLKRISALKDSAKVQVVEISLDLDTATWLADVRQDTVKYRQTWAPGAVSATAISSLAVPRAPFFIVADSTGSQVYRGSSIAGATDALDNLKK